MTSRTISPYLLEEPPTSVGKALLSRALAHWCAVHQGHSEMDIAEALGSQSPEIDERAQGDIHFASRMLGELIARGQLRTYVRPFGGGRPESIPASYWELDDFRQRMALSAIDPKRPFDPGAEPTHWIFVELDDFDALLEASLPEGELLREARAKASQPSTKSEAGPAAIPDIPVGHGRPERYLRLPEVRQRTGLSRSTIYRRIEQDRFPAGVDLGGNVAAWRESEVEAWIAKPG